MLQLVFQNHFARPVAKKLGLTTKSMAIADEQECSVELTACQAG